MTKRAIFIPKDPDDRFPGSDEEAAAAAARRAEHDEQIWETFLSLEYYHSRGIIQKGEIVESLKRVVLDE